MNDTMQKMAEDFRETCHELLDTLMGDIMDLEQHPDFDNLNRIYRAFHSIKGDAMLLGMERLADLAHQGEDSLYLLKNGKLDLSRATVDHLLHSLDMMRVALDEGRGIPPLDRTPAKTAPMKISPPGDKRLKILIVEDDFTCRTLLMEFLSKFGECHVAKDGLEALRAFTLSYEEKPPAPYNLICMDILMPQMDGSQACKTIREIERGKGVEGTDEEAAILMITGLNDPRNYVRACYECGANAYMVKPVDLFQLRQQLRSLNLTC